jgi:hypothetical protein
MAPDGQHDASQISLAHSSQKDGGISLVGADDESEWLHRNGVIC